MKILLGSESPRRKELLQSLGYEFQSVKINCEEIYPAELAVDQVAAYLAELKSKSFLNPLMDEVLITADTIVVIDGEILGKPKDKIEAFTMLQKLSGTTHQVYTSVCLRTDNHIDIRTDVANVSLNKLSDADITYYIENFEVLDKAGSYGVQDWLGMAKISKIEGSFYTIMGLPTHFLHEMLENLK